jgi:hypothetical protein
MISDNNTHNSYPSINCMKNISKAQGLARFILENQREKLLSNGDMTALDAIRDTLRALSMAQNDLTDLLKDHREEKMRMVNIISNPQPDHR